MTVGLADLHKAIRSVWSAQGLDWQFEQHWAEADRSVYLAMNDGPPSPGTPLPYCVYEQGTPTIVSRMTGHNTSEKHWIIDVPWEFRIYATQLDSDSRSSKQIAADLAEQVMRQFGGHPTQAPQGLTLDNGRHLLTQYVSDQGVPLGEDSYEWIVSYLFRLDVPYAK